MVNYIPILTTAFSIYFFIIIFKHYQQKKHAKYLKWWTLGVLTFGLGTLTESINVIFGWSAINTRIWYIVGALLGGFPLAQGTVYLLFKEKVGKYTSIIFIIIISIASAFVLLSPVSLPLDFNNELTGKIFTWQWVRLFSPFINLYAFLFLVGGAFYSAIKYYKLGPLHSRFLGNVFIAIGGLLPGIGGTFTRFGHVEVLFITELIGLIFIFVGYFVMKNDKEVSLHSQQGVS